MTLSSERRGLSIDAWQQEALDVESSLARLTRHLAEEEPRIHALVAEEDRFDRLRGEIETCPPGSLSRVPIGIKDIFHVAGLETRAGAQLPSHELTGPEASSIGKLKQAGGVVLGKTVSTEFAYFAPGPTRNPHNTEHTPGGSSSGSAAAVAAGYCPLALGTQTIGSISRPAAFCGIVGYKPTYGRIPIDGVIPLSPSLDHVGLFANSVADTAIAAAILCREWRSVTADHRPVLGIPQGPYLERASRAGLDHFYSLCKGLQSLDWDVRTVSLFDDFAEIEARQRTILAAEVAQVHLDWYSRFGDLYQPRTRELIESGQSISATRLAAALEEKARFEERLEEQTERAGVDLWLSPAAPGPAPAGLASTGDPVMNLPWTQAGVPTLSLPAGHDPSGLPLGLQVASRRRTDEKLLAWSESLVGDLDRIR